MDFLTRYSKDIRGDKTVKEVQCPWEGYDSSCENMGFQPISPSRGGAEYYNEENLAKELEKILNEFKKDLIPRRKLELIVSMVKIVSWLFQIHGYPGAIPEKAGKAYIDYVESLRTK